MPLQQMPDFTFKHSEQQNKLYQTMTAEEIKTAFDSRGDELRVFINGLVQILQSTTDGDSGADNIGATAISALGTVNTVQAILEALVNALQATTDGASGADFVKATAISGLTGDSVQALLEALKAYIDTHKTSGDHDSRYFTESELQSTTDGSAGADNIGATEIAALGSANTVQAILEALVNALQATTDGTSGADFVKATGIDGLTGSSVQALLEALKIYVDQKDTANSEALNTHKASDDHDSRYFTEAELQATTDGASGADKIGATPISGSPSTVQGILEWLKTQIDNTALGQIPDGSITDVKLSDDPGQIKDRVNTMLRIDTNITLTAANWVDDTATSGYWVYDVIDAEVTADTIVDVYIQRASMQTAIDAGIQSFCESASDSYRLFAESQPAADIVIDVKKTRQVV